MVDKNPKNYSSLSYNIYRRNYGERDRRYRESEFKFHQLGQILVAPSTSLPRQPVHQGNKSVVNLHRNNSYVNEMETFNIDRNGS